MPYDGSPSRTYWAPMRLSVYGSPLTISVRPSSRTSSTSAASDEPKCMIRTGMPGYGRVREGLAMGAREASQLARRRRFSGTGIALPGHIRPTAALAAVLATCVAVPGAAAAAEPAERYNAPGQVHAIVCATLSSSPASLRFNDASPTGFVVTDQLGFNDGRCPSNTVRLDFHEVFPSPAGSLLFHRGGNGYLDEPNTKYGLLSSLDVAGALGDPVPSGGGRGAPCALAAEPARRVSVESIPEEMHSKRPQDLPSGSNRGSSFEHYGDPGADQGDRTDIHYSYLLWSFVNVAGGGIVRTLLAPDEVVRPCDVEPVTMDSWDRDGAVNGQVTARYVRALVGTCPAYGWMVWSHTYNPGGGAPVAHHAPLPGALPPDPARNPACPESAAAAAPSATTGDASAAADGSATLTGTVDPRGVPATYRFEYGLGPDYGIPTDDGGVSARPGAHPATRRLGGLQPSTTYHYRIVSTSQHGTSFGADRTLTTPAPPPPPPPPPPPEIAALSVSPLVVKRSRSRTGTSARIAWTLTRPGSVTVTFLRATTGYLDRGTCRRAPARGVPRGRRRCTRWTTLPGSLRQAGAAATGRIRFGGWLAGRKLPLGRYRVRAIATEADRTGAARLAGFRLR